MLFFLFINVKMPTIVGSLTFISRKNLKLNRVKHEKSFITLGPDLLFAVQKDQTNIETTKAENSMKFSNF